MKRTNPSTGKVEDVVVISSAGSQMQNTTLQNATSTGNGTVFTVGSFKTLTISISGTSTSRTVLFEAADMDGNFTPFQGVRLSDLEMGVQTTGTNEKWQFEITGVTSFRARISAIAGGNVVVKGTAVA